MTVKVCDDVHVCMHMYLWQVNIHRSKCVCLYKSVGFGAVYRVAAWVNVYVLGVWEGRGGGAVGPQLAKRACPPRRGLEGEPRSGSNF